jgi:hypothetical protein
MKITLKALLLNIIILLVPNVSSQEVKYDRFLQFNGDDNEVYSIADGINGELYVAGQFRDTLRIADTTVFSLGSDLRIFITRIDKDLHVEEFKILGDRHLECYHPLIKCDNYGNIICTGDFYGTLALGESEQSLFGASLIKLDHELNPVWAKSNFSSGFNDIMDVEVDSDNNIFITGYFNNRLYVGNDTLYNSSESEAFLVKYSPDGNYLFAKVYGYIRYDIGTALEIDINNDVYIALTTTGRQIQIGDSLFYTHYDSNLPTTNTDSDMILVKLSNDGQFIWAQHYIGTGDDVIDDIEVNDSLEIYFSGRSKNGINVIDSLFSLYNLPWANFDRIDDIICVKLDKNRKPIWAKSINDDDFNFEVLIDLDNKGNCFLSADYIDEVYVDSQLIQNMGGRDYFVLKLDNEGNTEWVESPICFKNNKNSVLHVDQAGHLYLGGVFTGDIYFDGHPLNCALVKNGFLVRMPGFYANAGQSAYLCAGDSIVLGGQPSAYNGIQPYTFYWKPCGPMEQCNETNPKIEPTESNWYVLSVVDAGGYEVKDSVFIRVDSLNPIQFNLGDDFSICPGESIILSPDTIPVGTLVWSTGETSPNIIQEEEGEYILSISNGCGITSDSIFVTLNNNFEIKNVVNICKGDSILFGGEYRKLRGRYYDSLISLQGCDSVNILELSTTYIDNSIFYDAPFIKSGTRDAEYKWMDCDNNFEIISYSSENAFIPTYQGNFSVAIYKNGCIDTSSCFSYELSSLSGSLSGLIKVWPNPTGGEFTISFDNEIVNAKIKLKNLIGEVVVEKELVSGKIIILDIPGPSGLYFVEVFSGEEVVSNFRIIKR